MPGKRQESIAFGKQLRNLRKKQGFSQEAFADKAGIDRSYMGQLERGEKNPTISIVYRVAKALGLPPSKLLKN